MSVLLISCRLICVVYSYLMKTTSRLVPELPFHGLPEALVQSLIIPLPEGSKQWDIWQNQAYWFTNDVPDEPIVEELGLKPLLTYPVLRTQHGCHLEISGRRIGVIAVSNKRTEGGFTSRDIQHLQILTAQASIVVENVRLLQREQRIDAELIGLQEITHAIGALSHEGEFYSEITERIGRLMGIQYCGILLFDPATNHLVSKLPFYGLDDEDVKDYVIHVEPNSVIDELWTDEEYWYSNRVQTDTLVFAAKLDGLAEKLNIEKTLSLCFLRVVAVLVLFKFLTRSTAKISTTRTPVNCLSLPHKPLLLLRMPASIKRLIAERRSTELTPYC